jgi:uncharacterized SAM-dependent methyltransferase
VKYFKNTELAKLYHVSEKSIRNWIEGTKSGKLDLQLYEAEGRSWIANTTRNNQIIETLVQKGKKYKNTRGHKVITPSDKFYELFSRKQVLDIISNLEIHRELPRQYNYFDGGADYWDEFAQQMWRAETPNILRSTVELLQANGNAVDLLLQNHPRVNVIDVGVGNALPVKGLLANLLERKLLHRYIAVDISTEMLEIARKNVEQWFDGHVEFEGHVRDVTYERFSDLVVDDMLSKDTERTVNLVLLLGGTLMNFRSPYDVLKTIHGSMGYDDLLIYTDRADTEAGRRNFDVNADAQVTELSAKYRLVLDLLNIDPSLYDVEMGFNEQRLERYIRVRLKLAITLSFEFESGKRSVSLNKGDTILMWRSWHQTTLDIVNQFETAGLALLQASVTRDRQFLMTISGVDTGSARPPKVQ